MAKDSYPIGFVPPPNHGKFFAAGRGHYVQLGQPDENGNYRILWRHPCPVSEGAPYGFHDVSGKGWFWTATGDPPTLAPSLHCDPAEGGCGAHGFIREGQWVG